MDKFTDFQARLGYAFNAPLLLRQALTHASYIHEKGLAPSESNERLEFLGDAVLELCISDLLYRRFPEMSEGQLTKRRAGLVCEPSLAGLARELDVGKVMLVGIGAHQTGGRERDSVLSDCVEALFGAVYLDGGHEAARSLIFRLFEPLVDNVNAPPRDYKTTLQEILQKNSRATAVYRIIKESGPSHNKEFIAEVSHMDKILGTGQGGKKKDAEQDAAMVALNQLGHL
ncbi:MAG: ribonuclease III [Defluviitaleaceae bacterium]|nr:ribonuclease III [Defluviitaleaceae bacterium]